MAGQIEFNAMKQDAIRRVREMERRSENYIQAEKKAPLFGGQATNGDGSERRAESAAKATPQQRMGSQAAAQNPHRQSGPQFHSQQHFHAQTPQSPLSAFKGIEGLIPNINIDQDKIILIVLAVVLYKNGADIKLLLALGYLLL